MDSTVVPVTTPAPMPGVGQLLSRAAHEAGDRYSQLVLLQALPILLLACVQILQQIMGGSPGSFDGALSAVILALVLVVLSLITQAASVGAALVPPHTRTTAELIRWGASRAQFVLLAGILLVVGGMAGFVLLVIPGVWFLLRYGFAPVVATELGVGPSEAFRLSGSYTKGLVGPLLWRVVILWLAVVAVQIILNILLAIVFPPFLQRYALIGAQVLIAPWYTMYGVLLYQACKQRAQAQPVAAPDL